MAVKDLESISESVFLQYVLLKMMYKNKVKCDSYGKVVDCNECPRYHVINGEMVYFCPWNLWDVKSWDWEKKMSVYKSKLGGANHVGIFE